jgi:hypothetical protein
MTSIRVPAVAVLLAGLLLGGCGGTETAGAGVDRPLASAPGSTTPSPTPFPTASPDLPSPTAVDPLTAVHLAALTRRDLPAGFGADQMRSGDVVEGQVTLSLCGARFPSEALRLARHQVAFAYRGDPDRGVSNEVVAYRGNGAQQALRELRAAIDHCPAGFVSSGLARVPDVRYRIEELPPHGSWQAGTIAVRVDARTRDGVDYPSVSVYQVHGHLLSALYLRTTGGPASLDELSALLSQRLDRVTVGSGA